MNKEEEVTKYRQRLKPYIDEAMANFERTYIRQKIYENYVKKLKGVKNANNV